MSAEGETNVQPTHGPPAGAVEKYARWTRAQLLAELHRIEWKAKRDLREANLDLSSYREELAVQNQELVEKQRLLQQSRDRFAELFEFAPIPYLTLDSLGVVDQVNDLGCRLLGIEKARLIGKPLLPRVVESDRQTWLNHLIICRSGRSATCELSMLQKNGEFVPVQLHSRPVRSAVNGNILFRTVIHDLTEIKRAEDGLERARRDLEARVEERTAELQRANEILRNEARQREKRELALRDAIEALRRSNEDLNQFAYAASHDLKEPLRTIATYSQLLAERCAGTIDSEAEGYLQHLVDSARRMNALLKDLLEYARAGQKLEAQEETADAAAALRIATVNLEAAIAQSGARVTRDSLPLVEVHGAHLVQVFQNLIENAIKYRGTDPPCIQVSAERKGDEWVFSVRDNGIGIDPKFSKQVFGIFKRLHANKYPGTGMGLAICSKIVSRYGGRIWVESELGKGSTFRFTLPAGGSPRG